jgi:hypothetical protein
LRCVKPADAEQKPARRNGIDRELITVTPDAFFPEFFATTPTDGNEDDSGVAARADSGVTVDRPSHLIVFCPKRDLDRYAIPPPRRRDWPERLRRPSISFRVLGWRQNVRTERSHRQGGIPA